MSECKRNEEYFSFQLCEVCEFRKMCSRPLEKNGVCITRELSNKANNKQKKFVPFKGEQNE